jgi:hypothetical protein
VTPRTAAGSPPRVPWPWTPRGTLGLLLAWAAGHVLLRLALSPALTVDDAREAVLGQSFEWGYQARQPPLYDWLVWAAFRLLGPGVLALTVLKYAVLVLAFWLVHLTARRLLADPRLATLATFSFLLMIPVSWNVHEALTHTITVLAACAGTAYVLVRLPERPTPGMYATLGAALGLGALSKFTFLVFAAALLGAALLVDRFRPHLLTPRLGLALLVAGALVLPYALWFVGHGHDLGRLYAREVRLDEGDPWLAEAGAGLYYVARIALYYLGPLALVLGACFPGLYRRLPPGAGAGGPAGGRLMGALLGCVLALLGAAALAGVLPFLKFRWLMPAFALVPLYAFWRIERQPGAPRRVTAFAVILAVVAGALAAALAVRVLGAGLFARPYKLNEPYDLIAAGLVGAGFRRGTIVGGWDSLAGNLRIRFLDSRVVHVEFPDYRPPPRPPGGPGGQCLVVWDRRRGEASDPRPRPEVPDDLRALAATLGVTVTGAEPVRSVDAPFRFDPRHVRRVHFILLPGAGDCR